MEHFYESIEGWFDFEDLYREAVRRMPEGYSLTTVADEVWQTAQMVEVGVYKGRSLFFLAVEAFNSGKPIHVYAVDKFDWPATAARDFSRLRAEHGLTQVVSMVEATSLQASRQFDDESLDFVFIDADHSYEMVKADIAHWWPKVKPGGILAGHDYCDEFPGVRQAVLEHCLLMNLPPQGVIIPPRSWWVDKR